jgi:hypothetical protein
MSHGIRTGTAFTGRMVTGWRVGVNRLHSPGGHQAGAPLAPRCRDPPLGSRHRSVVSASRIANICDVALSGGLSLAGGSPGTAADSRPAGQRQQSFGGRLIGHEHPDDTRGQGRRDRGRLHGATSDGDHARDACQLGGRDGDSPPGQPVRQEATVGIEWVQDQVTHRAPGLESGQVVVIQDVGLHE